MNLKSLNAALGLISIGLLPLTISSCVTPSPISTSKKYFYNGNYSAAAANYSSENAAELSDKNNRSFSLHSLELAQYNFDAGRYTQAYSQFRSATESISEFQSKERFMGAVYLAEGAKSYKGEAYDRATAHFNMGLVHMMNNEYNKAIKNFRRATQEDASTVSSIDDHKNDFSIAWYFLGICYKIDKQTDNARIAFSKSRIPSSYTNTEFNSVLVVSSGRGPAKKLQRANSGGLHVFWNPAPSPYDNVDVSLSDSGPTYRGVAALNISEQALQEQDAMKAARTISGSVPDTRHWHNIPDYYFIVPMNIPDKTTLPIALSIQGLSGKRSISSPKTVSIDSFNASKFNTYYVRLNP